MGGAASRFGDTDWDIVDGGLKDESETLDGTKPTKHHAILTLTKHSTVNQREFDVKDDRESLLYTTKGVEGTVKSFEVLGKGGERLFRVQTDSSRQTWDIFSIGRVVYSGQLPDEEATQKAGDALYRKAQLVIAWDRHHGDVFLYGDDETDAAGTPRQDDSILKVEEVRSITPMYQSYHPKTFSLGLPHAPLVGHWVWEHTVHVHKVKMHLAKGTDVALHVILGVITNMVRTERDAAGVGNY